MPGRHPVAIGVAAIGKSRVAAVALLAALAWWSPGAAAAEAYKCVAKGVTTYQDYPCSGTGSVFRTWPGDDRTAPSGAESLSRLRAEVAAMEQARRGRESAAEIEGIEREIQGYEQAEQGELAALRARQDYASNNPYGALWERAAVMDAIAKEMQSVTEKYAAKKQAARDRIAALRKAREQNPSPR